MAAKKRSFEQAMDMLEDIVERMEQPGVGLEECLKLYKEGVGLTVFCGERLNAVEQEVTMLMKTTDGCLEKAFDEDTV